MLAIVTHHGFVPYKSSPSAAAAAVAVAAAAPGAFRCWFPGYDQR